jgi:uroporphyrinogen-III decarboxylase
VTSQERVKNALNHRESDKVPVDFGSTAITGINVSVVYQLRKAYNLNEHPVKVVDCYQMLGEVEDDLAEKLGCDCIALPAYKNLFGFRNDGWKPWTLADGTPVLVPSDFNTAYEAGGGLYQYPQGDTTVPPSGFMPSGGYYFDATNRETPPFDEDNPSLDDNLEEFGRTSDEELRHIQKEAESLRKNTDRAIVSALGGTALGDIAFVPATFMKHPKGIRDITEWYVSLASRQDFLKELFDRQTQIAVENLKLLKQAAGENIDVLVLCGADFGNQTSTMCSPETIREVFLPYYKRMIGWIHANTGWKVFKHCCGAIKPLIPLFIEAGFDILNPVQNSARDMDAQTLKDEFGGSITFWGGGVDTQKTLPFGTPDEVYKQVTERVKIYSKNGGFVFNTIHNTQFGVPVENFLAMIEAVKQFR